MSGQPPLWDVGLRMALGDGTPTDTTVTGVSANDEVLAVRAAIRRAMSSDESLSHLLEVNFVTMTAPGGARESWG